MTRFVVYEVEQGGDVDGTGPERWRGMVLGYFDTSEEAYAFMDRQFVCCEMDEE